MRTGRCLCGAVRYTAELLRTEVSACHCAMCRRWAGGPLLSVFVKELTWQGEKSPTVIQSSEWAERGFCARCGSSLFYRITAPGRFRGNTSVSLGTLDDPSGLTFTKEWFIDRKPDCYALAGDHERVTEAEAFALLGGSG